VRDIIRLAGDRMTVFAGVLGYESFWLGAEGWSRCVFPRWSGRAESWCRQRTWTALALTR
jgi:4-hydroxy-tetrahydrodipicolinate synthase